MAWNDLSDVAAVEAAMRECDRLGRQTFLNKYGYGEARDYYVRNKGQLYDSKAIVGVAHGYQFPDKGALRSTEFSGGLSTVVKKLRDLGFELTDNVRTDTSRWYWSFCANPKRYRVQEAVDHLEIDRWTIGRSQPRAGDLCLIWQTLDGKGHRGIVAFGQILTDPVVQTDSANPYWVDASDSNEEYARVAVSYQVPDGLPLWIDDPRASNLLEGLSVAKAQGGTIFQVSETDWSAIMAVVPCEFPAIEEQELNEFTKFRSRALTGQGFGLNAAERRAVELWAMDLARSHYDARGFEVTDVSSNCSFDLLCRKDGEELRVEVKGTTGDGSKVVLTRNEVKESASINYALFVVRGIELDRSEPESPRADGGSCLSYEPFVNSDHELSALSYACTLDSTRAKLVGK